MVCNPVNAVIDTTELTVMVISEVEDAPSESNNVTVSTKVPTCVASTVTLPVVLSMVIPEVLAVMAK